MFCLVSGIPTTYSVHALAPLKRGGVYRYTPIDLIYRRLRNGRRRAFTPERELALAGRVQEEDVGLERYTGIYIRIRSQTRDTAPRAQLFIQDSLLVLLLMQQTRLPRSV